MGMGPSGILGFGIVIDEDGAYKIAQILEIEDPEGWEEAENYISEYFYDKLKGLEFVSWGYCDNEEYLLCIKGYAHNTCTWDYKVIDNLENPMDTSTLKAFCDKYGLNKDYSWKLGSYYG